MTPDTLTVFLCVWMNFWCGAGGSKERQGKAPKIYMLNLPTRKPQENQGFRSLGYIMYNYVYYIYIYIYILFISQQIWLEDWASPNQGPTGANAECRHLEDTLHPNLDLWQKRSSCSSSQVWKMLKSQTTAWDGWNPSNGINYLSTGDFSH